ncbi:MAG: hypothetical protein HZA80_02900 [Candidatus Taylorbacteria bacterium]|nr:hypothetical protein [Candidatus Taylorbacteria bacterium]
MTGIALLTSSIVGATTTDADIAKDIQIKTLATVTTPIVAAATTTQAMTLEAYLRVYFADTPALVEIAKCESTFMHYDKKGRVVRGMVDPTDVGVMQINERYHDDQATKLGFDIRTVEGNLAYAKYLYGKQGSTPWNASKPCWGKKVAALSQHPLAIANK